MGVSAREAIWAKEKAERVATGRWWGAPLMARPVTRGHWRVVKEHGDGRSVVFRDRISERDAAKIAGLARDRCPDSEVEGGWNYQARACPWIPRGRQPPPAAASETLMVLELIRVTVGPFVEPERGQYPDPRPRRR